MLCFVFWVLCLGSSSRSGLGSGNCTGEDKGLGSGLRSGSGLGLGSDSDKG